MKRPCRQKKSQLEEYVEYIGNSKADGDKGTVRTNINKRE